MGHMNGDSLRKLYPGLSDEDLNRVSENFDLYLELAWEIMEDGRAMSTVDGDQKQS